MTPIIHMFPAAHGDSILVEYGPKETRARLLIDFGPVGTYEGIRDLLLKTLGSDRVIDLFVITHVDTDHIEGALKLLQAKDLGIEFGDIWFNDFDHLSADRAPVRGGIQGQYLAALLDDKPWNQAVDGLSVRVPDDGVPLVLATDETPGESFTILSPNRAKARKMAESWKKQCEAKKIPLDRVAEVLDLLESDSRYDPSRGGPDPVSTKTVHFGSDSTAPNGSSIAMLLETRGYRLLLTGDAQPDLLAESIRQIADERDEHPLRIDAFKLAHHGSQGNITPELLDLIDCELFLVSSNGDHFKHPDHATIELIASRAKGRQPRVVFNYRSAFTQGWAADARICAEYGDNGHSTVKFVSDIANNAYGPLT